MTGAGVRHQGSPRSRHSSEEIVVSFRPSRKLPELLRRIYFLFWLTGPRQTLYTPQLLELKSFDWKGKSHDITELAPSSFGSAGGGDLSGSIHPRAEKEWQRACPGRNTSSHITWQANHGRKIHQHSSCNRWRV